MINNGQLVYHLKEIRLPKTTWPILVHLVLIHGMRLKYLVKLRPVVICGDLHMKLGSGAALVVGGEFEIRRG